jgi:hypothetical protein
MYSQSTIQRQLRRQIKKKKNTRYLLHTVVLLVLCLSKNLLLIINALSLMVKPILPVILG